MYPFDVFDDAIKNVQVKVINLDPLHCYLYD